MNTQYIEDKLDQLAEFKSKKVEIEFEKRDLLNGIKVPEEIQAIVANGRAKILTIDPSFQKASDIFEQQIMAELAAIVIPDEIKVALAEIDRKRAEILEKKKEHDDLVRRSIDIKVKEIQDEIDAKVKSTFDAIALRQKEIEEEYHGRSEAVDKNIADLEAQIKDDVKEAGVTVKGKFFMAVFNRGRVTWDNNKLDGFILAHPELKEARKEGEPSISIRSI